MAKGVINFFEQVYVKVHQAYVKPGTMAFNDFLIQPVIKSAPVGKSCQVVKVGLLPDQVFRLFLFSDVLHYAAQPGN